jgi:hypothetical protein
MLTLTDSLYFSLSPSNVILNRCFQQEHIRMSNSLPQDTHRSLTRDSTLLQVSNPRSTDHPSAPFFDTTKQYRNHLYIT